MHIQANYSLKPYNTFQIDVQAKYFIEISRQSDIPILRTDFKLSSMPWFIIGAGSNLLFTHDMNCVIVRCSYDKINLVKEDKDNVWLSVGAGLNWHDLVTYTVDNNLWGLENLALIPGTVGAAPVQNIGAYGAEARDSITRVQALNIFNGERKEFRNAGCNFGYRTSIFKQEYNNQMLVHRVTFRLTKLQSGRANLIYDLLGKSFQNMKTSEITPKHIYEKVIEIRLKKIPDPKIQGNAGSFFKNPIITASYMKKILQEFKDIPHHKTVNNNYKIPAAWLIQSAGWKGKKLRRAGVSKKHALFIVNLANATGQDILDLSTKIQEDVDQKFGIHLEPEVIII